MKQSLFIIVAAIVLPNVALADPQGDSTPSPCVVILSGTTGNFSPQLGDTATISVDLTPNPPSGGYSDIYFECEIIRELNGGGTQHIAWVDVIPATPALNESRGADFTTLSMSWEGVAGASQEQAEGPESFTGVSDSFYRILPEVVGGQCVPPPLYKIAARLRKYSDDSIVCEDLKTIYVKQVVKVDFSSASALMQQGLYRSDGVTLMDPTDNPKFGIIKDEMLIQMAQYYGGHVNIEFGEFPDVLAPYSTLYFEIGNDGGDWGETDDVDFGNADPGNSAYVYVLAIRQRISYDFSYYENYATPVALSEQVTAYARTASHEVGHLLGLTKVGGVLDGIDINGDHNKSPHSKLDIMDPGSSHSLLSKIGRNGPWSFRAVNQGYLEWILPK